MSNRVQLWLCLSLLLAISACAGAAGGIDPRGDIGMQQAGLRFAFPDTQLLKQAAFTEAGLIFDGAPNTISQAVYPQFYRNVATNGTSGDFTPTWASGSANSTTVGAAMYGLTEVHDFNRDKTIRLNWAQSNGMDKVFVGMANWGTERWDWYQCDASGVATLDAARWGDYTSKVIFGQHATVFLVVVLDNTTWQLANGRLGAPQGVQAPVIVDVDPTTAVEGMPGMSINVNTSGDAATSWDWTFGAGITPSTSSDQTPLIDIGAPAVVSCSVTVSNAGGSDTLQFDFTITPATQAPDITFVTPTTGQAGDLMTAVAINGGGPASTWAWDFGGGATPDTSALASPDITLGAAGSYTCSVTASNSMGSDTFPFQLDIDPAGNPPAVDSVMPTSGTAGASTNFQAIVMGGPVDNYLWDFGGGAAPNTATDAAPTVTLGAAGSYNCSLTVDNADGSDTFPFTLTVNPPAGPPDITDVQPQGGSSGSLVTFVPTYTGQVDTWAWDFGGGAAPNTSALEQPQVTLGPPFPAYTVTVTATNGSGSDQFQFMLSVTP